MKFHEINPKSTRCMEKYMYIYSQNDILMLNIDQKLTLLAENVMILFYSKYLNTQYHMYVCNCLYQMPNPKILLRVLELQKD